MTGGVGISSSRPWRAGDFDFEGEAEPGESPERFGPPVARLFPAGILRETRPVPIMKKARAIRGAVHV